MGGDVVMDSLPLLVRDMLCERVPGGGGPGGGGGMGMPGSQGTWGPVRDLAEMGVSAAPAEAALRAAGAAALGSASGSGLVWAGLGCGIWRVKWAAGLLRADEGTEVGGRATGGVVA